MPTAFSGILHSCPITSRQTFSIHHFFHPNAEKSWRTLENVPRMLTVTRCSMERASHSSIHFNQKGRTTPVTQDTANGDIKYNVGYSTFPLLSKLPFQNLNSNGTYSVILFNFLACLTTGALVSLTITAIITLNAMRRVASSLEKLADTAREELPSTMAAIRLSGMEISDLTVELNDLSQEISEGVRRSAQAVRATEVGIRQVGALASSKAKAMVEERANLPVVTIKPAMKKAATTTSNLFKHAQNTFMEAISAYVPTFRNNRSEM